METLNMSVMHRGLNWNGETMLEKGMRQRYKSRSHSKRMERRTNVVEEARAPVAATGAAHAPWLEVGNTLSLMRTPHGRPWHSSSNEKLQCERRRKE